MEAMRKKGQTLHFILMESIDFFDKWDQLPVSLDYQHTWKPDWPYNSKFRYTVVKEIHSRCSGKTTVSEYSLGSLSYINMTISEESIAHRMCIKLTVLHQTILKEKVH